MVRPPSIPFSDGEISLDRLIGQKWKQTNKQTKKTRAKNYVKSGT